MIKRSRITAVIHIFGFVIITLILTPVQIIAKLFGCHYTIPRLYHSLVCRVIGLKVTVKGTPVTQTGQAPVLFASNHISYHDIAAIGSVIKGSFVAKSEISKWPIYGWLASLQNTIFITRKVARAHKHIDKLAAEIQQGNNVILFSEGTTSNGLKLRPIRSTLFHVVDELREQKDIILPIQPMTIKYTHANGTPLNTQAEMDVIAWYDDVPFLPHFLYAIGIWRVGVEISFGDVIIPTAHQNRKDLARLVDDQWQTLYL